MRISQQGSTTALESAGDQNGLHLRQVQLFLMMLLCMQCTDGGGMRAQVGFTLKPFGFFDCNPGVDLPYAANTASKLVNGCCNGNGVANGHANGNGATNGYH
jgi:hypothetical protein